MPGSSMEARMHCASSSRVWKFPSAEERGTDCLLSNALATTWTGREGGGGMTGREGGREGEEDMSVKAAEFWGGGQGRGWEREGGREGGLTLRGITWLRAQKVSQSRGMSFSMTVWRRKSRLRTGLPGCLLSMAWYVSLRKSRAPRPMERMICR